MANPNEIQVISRATTPTPLRVLQYLTCIAEPFSALPPVGPSPPPLPSPPPSPSSTLTSTSSTPTDRREFRGPPRTITPSTTPRCPIATANSHPHSASTRPSRWRLTHL